MLASATKRRWLQPVKTNLVHLLLLFQTLVVLCPLLPWVALACLHRPRWVLTHTGLLALIVRVLPLCLLTFHPWILTTVLHLQVLALLTMVAAAATTTQIAWARVVHQEPVALLALHLIRQPI